MSTMHKGDQCDPSIKKKPESILFYNKTKCGVDMLDSMCRQMSTKAASKKWTVSVFCNYLDIIGVNSWIIYRKKYDPNISRRDFLFQLCEQLTITNRREEAEEHIQQEICQTLITRVQCRVKVHCQRNKTINLCDRCSKPVCGKCTAKICVNCSNQP